MKSVVSEKGQITIPKAIREKLGIVPGTVLEIESKEGKLIAMKWQPIDVYAKWRGKARVPRGNNVDDYIRAIRE